MDDIIVVLKRSFDQKEFTAGDYKTITVVEVGCDDYVGNPCLIFHRDEDESLGCTRPLPRYNTACSPHKFSVSARPQFLC